MNGLTDTLMALLKKLLYISFAVYYSLCDCPRFSCLPPVTAAIAQPATAYLLCSSTANTPGNCEECAFTVLHVLTWGLEFHGGLVINPPAWGMG